MCSTRLVPSLCNGVTSDAPGRLQGVGQQDCTSVSLWPTPNPRSLTDAAACMTAQDHWDGQAGFGGITHGWTDWGCSFSPGYTGTRKLMNAWSLWWSGCTPRSQELARLAHGKGCWWLLQSPTASSSGPACWIHPDPELPLLLPGSSLGAGGGSCAAGSKLGAMCAPWMSLQAGKLLLVPTMSLPQGWDKPPCPPQCPPSLSWCCRIP